MSDSNEYSIKTVLATAIISFAVSGVGGYILSNWQNRAKPEIVVSSVGFSSSEDLIEITQPLVESSRNSKWMRTLKKYETYGSLDDEYKRLIRIRKQLEKGVSTTEAWLKKNRTWESGNIGQVAKDKILESPYANETIVGSTIIGLMRRNEVGEPPVSMETLESHQSVVELFRDDNGWRIHLGRQSTGFPDENARGKKSKKSIHLLAISFAKGSAQNIYFYTKYFVDETYRELDLEQV